MCVVLQADEYYFERIHALPWSVQLTLEGSGASPMPLHCECFVYSVPIFPAARTADGEPVTEDESGEEALATYIVALMLDSEGKPKPVQIPGNAVVRAKVQVGPGAAVYESKPISPLPAAGTALHCTRLSCLVAVPCAVLLTGVVFRVALAV
jgi:hypothetical protein